MSSMTRKLKRNKSDITMAIKFKCDICGVNGKIKCRKTVK